MNKKLLAMAVGAAMVAGSAAVMADATVYGKINVGVVSFDDGDKATGAKADGIAIFDESSRLGVKGSMGLDNGMKAIFKMEGTVDLEGPGGFSFNRDTYIGLTGDFGEVTMGRRNTSYKDATGKMDLFSDMWGDFTGSGFGDFDQREENMIRYKNKFGMVSLSVDLQMAEGVDDGVSATGDETAMGNSIAVGFAPMKGVMVSLASATCGGTCAAGAEDASAQKLGVQWKGGQHLVNFVYKMQDDAGAVDPEETIMALQYGLSMGMNSLQLGYQTLDADAADSNATQISVALVHKMSKKTKAYVAYTAIDNDDMVMHDGRLDSGISALSPTEAGADPSAFGVGITHNF